MSALRYGELFAGAGGMSQGLERAGMSCAFHAELADFPRRVLKAHWPDTPLYGDVAKLNGRELIQRHGPIDLLAGGSPCQDLSVAGKRRGIEGARSGLFYEQIRLWEETGATYLLWENVAGALSSNQYADFAAVLSAIVGGTVPVPSAGWAGAGVVAGPAGVAAWRLLDAQWFGVPQRRLRVFVLGARAGGCDPAEVLLEPQGVRRHPPTRGEAREGAPAGARDGVGFQSSQSGVRSVETFATLDANYGSRRHNGVVSWDDECNPGVEIIGTLPARANAGATRAGVISFGWQNSESQGDDVSQGSDAPLRTGTTPAVLAFAQNQRDEVRTMAVCGALAADAGAKQQTYIVGSLQAADGKSQFFGAQAVASGHVVPTSGIPRRLMPIECERLMNWPDGWTDVPDEKGKPASDAVRYKACGNGVVSSVAEWIAARLVAVHTAMVADQERAA